MERMETLEDLRRGNDAQAWIKDMSAQPVASPRAGSLASAGTQHRRSVGRGAGHWAIEAGRHQNLRGVDLLRRVKLAGDVVVDRLVDGLAILERLDLVEHEVCGTGRVAPGMLGMPSRAGERGRRARPEVPLLSTPMGRRPDGAGARGCLRAVAPKSWALRSRAVTLATLRPSRSYLW